MFLCEGLGAQLARVWLDAGVQAHVKCHVASVGERLTPHATSERFLAGVDAQMLLE